MATSAAAAAAAEPPLRDAEVIFRTKSITEIRALESAARREVDEKQKQLRDLVGRRYRDLIESADAILLMASSCDSISTNLSAIHSSLCSLSSAAAVAATTPRAASSDPARALVFAAASRVKYLIDTPENIWGRLDEHMLLEAAGRYLRARTVHRTIAHSESISRFPLLWHQWQIVLSFKLQISLRSRERLAERGLGVAAYADALAAVATIDELGPTQAITLFLESRRSWIAHDLASSINNGDSFAQAMCQLVKLIRSSLGQAGLLFLPLLNEMPLFYKTVLGSPPGSQLFGGIPNPEEEVRLWKGHREDLEVAMVALNSEYVASSCSSWLKSCCDIILGNSGRPLIDSIASGEQLALTEKLVRETLDSQEGLDSTLEQWLQNVFGSEIKSPWNQIRTIVIKDDRGILEDGLEEAFLAKMKEIVKAHFENLKLDIRMKDSIQDIVAHPDVDNDFQAYLKKAFNGDDIWFSDPSNKKTGNWYCLKPVANVSDFKSCLNSYLGPEITRIRDAVDDRCASILEDLLSFVEVHNSSKRLRELVPYVQVLCHKTIADLVKEIEEILDHLSDCLGNNKQDQDSQPFPVIVERSLFIGRLLFALWKHSAQIAVILGSPREWVQEKNSRLLFGRQTSFSSRHSRGSFDSLGFFNPRSHASHSPRSPSRQFADTPRRQINSAAAAALFAMADVANPKLNELQKLLQRLCINAHDLWITWFTNELSTTLSRDVIKDDSLSSLTPLRGWEVTVIKHELSEGPLEMQITLPSMPSVYIISFLFLSCLEIHRVGGHVLDKTILQNFARRLLEKVASIYESFVSGIEAGKSHVSEKGVLQILFDIRFTADILSGGKQSASTLQASSLKKLDSNLQVSINEPVMELIHKLSQRLDPINWATYEPYLWENEKQSYKRLAVLFGFLVQLNRLHTDTVQKLPTKPNTDYNILRCSTVPRFKYLPISAPALSSRVVHKSTTPKSTDGASKSPWKTYSDGEQSPKQEFDDTFSFGAATPILKSFVTQVGSKFGESTSRWLADGQVGRLKDRSAAAMSTFGDIIPGPAAGFLSSLTSGSSRYDT